MDIRKKEEEEMDSVKEMEQEKQSETKIRSNEKQSEAREGELVQYRARIHGWNGSLHASSRGWSNVVGELNRLTIPVYTTLTT